jgi:type II secretory pathway pseudopilin PulG
MKQRDQRGFTLVELMIYTGLTAVIIGLFAGILITVTRIQGEQNSSASVTQQLNFLMNTIKRHIHSSVEYSIDEEDNSLTLVIDPATSPMTTKVLSLDTTGHRILLASSSPDGTTTEPLSSVNIGIDELIFTDLRQGSSTAIQIVITASATTTNPQTDVSRTLQSTAAIFVQEQ